MLHKLANLCKSRRISDTQKTICEMYSDLRINSDTLAGMLHKLDRVKVIPKGGLSNSELEGIMEVYERDIESFKWLGILTADFAVCNV